MSSSLTAIRPPNRIVHLAVLNGSFPLLSTFASGMFFLFNFLGRVRLLRDRHTFLAGRFVSFGTALRAFQPRQPKLLRAHHALWPRQHDHDQQRGVDDEPVTVKIAGKFAQQLRQNRDHDRAQHGARNRSHATEHDHDYDLDRADKLKVVRMQKLPEVAEECSSYTSKGGADDERKHFVASGIDTHRFRRQLVFTNRDQRAANIGVDDVVNDHDREDGKAADPDEVCILRNNQAAIPGWNAPAKAGGAANAIDVENDYANDFRESQRDDGQVVTAQSQTRNSNHQTRQRRDQ